MSASLRTVERCLDIDGDKRALNLSRCVLDHSTQEGTLKISKLLLALLKSPFGFIILREKVVLDQNEDILKDHSLFALCEIVRDTVPHCSLAKSGSVTVNDRADLKGDRDLIFLLYSLIGLFLQIWIAVGSRRLCVWSCVISCYSPYECEMIMVLVSCICWEEGDVYFVHQSWFV